MPSESETTYWCPTCRTTFGEDDVTHSLTVVWHTCHSSAIVLPDGTAEALRAQGRAEGAAAERERVNRECGNDPDDTAIPVINPVWLRLVTDKARANSRRQALEEAANVVHERLGDRWRLGSNSTWAVLRNLEAKFRTLASQKPDTQEDTEA